MIIKRFTRPLQSNPLSARRPSSASSFSQPKWRNLQITSSHPILNPQSSSESESIVITSIFPFFFAPPSPPPEPLATLSFLTARPSPSSSFTRFKFCLRSSSFSRSRRSIRAWRDSSGTGSGSMRPLSSRRSGEGGWR